MARRRRVPESVISGKRIPKSTNAKFISKAWAGEVIWFVALGHLVTNMRVIKLPKDI